VKILDGYRLEIFFEDGIHGADIKGQLMGRLKDLPPRDLFNSVHEKRRLALEIRSSPTWKKFLETQVQLIHAMDFFTVDTMPGKRF
jgi:hypothetical protein